MVEIKNTMCDFSLTHSFLIHLTTLKIRLSEWDLSLRLRIQEDLA